jgi:hypothetical protein
MNGYILGFGIGAFGVSLSSGMWRKNYWGTGTRFFRYRAVVSHPEVEWKMKSPFLDMKLHTSEEAAPLALISLTGVLVNVVGC